MAQRIYLAGAARTAIGAFSGAFEQTPAPVLGSAVIKAALQRAGLAAEQVDEVVFGNVLGAGLGQNVARQVSLGA
jgi:acetyl-CoA C-acetyltransferase